MTKYIGVKIVEAVPMTRFDYNELRGWDLPSDEDGTDPGLLKDDGNGHIQWDPAATFERDFRSCDAMTFGLAIEAMKLGEKVARAGWNGKGMFVYMVDGSVVDRSNLRGAAHRHISFDDKVAICPHVDMKSADGSIVIGWLASQTDILAEDWQIVE